MLLSSRNNVDLRTETDAAGSGAKRRGATMMEYLMMISLIIVVCLIAIGYLGTANNTNMTSSSGAINKSINKGG